jgi:hypothetical protein
MKWKTADDRMQQSGEQARRLAALARYPLNGHPAHSRPRRGVGQHRDRSGNRRAANRKARHLLREGRRRVSLQQALIQAKKPERRQPACHSQRSGEQGL